ncbi:MAG: hypothetical protein R3247_15140 [Rhodothermales bacterium]|nr:hypothetical protein [Rhodothermales bacterium]
MPDGSTPLVRKLGLKAGQRAFVFDAPPHYAGVLGPLPGGLRLLTAPEPELDFAQLFVPVRGALEARLPEVVPLLSRHGMLWICWPKKTSPLALDLAAGDVRAAGLAAGLVDVKVCAIDADWSGLKFVYRRADR